MTSTMKRATGLLAVLAAAILALAMTVPAWAASITIETGADAGTTQSETTKYYYYKILEADIGDGVGQPNHDTGVVSSPESYNVAYYVDSPAKATALDDTGLFTVTRVNDSHWNVELKNSSTTGEQIAAALDSIKTTFDTAHEFTMSSGSAVANNLTDGYYLVTSDLGTKVAVQTLGAVKIKEKNQYPTSNKEENKQTASIGEEVTYTVTVEIPDTVAEHDIVVTDTISNGLTLDPSITVSGAVDDLRTLTFTGTAPTYTVTIPAANVKANHGKTLTLEYKATVNSNAVVNVAETNAAHIQYDNYVTKDVTVEVKTHGFTLKKIDGAGAEGKTAAEKLTLDTIDGAEFSLWTAATDGTQIKLTKVEGVYRVDPSATTSAKIEAGEATIEGLAAGTYYLQEDKAPATYNQLSQRVPVEVSESTSAAGADIAVENNRGTQLPSTGGIGTTIFYVIGGILIAVAAIFLITRKRVANARKEDEEI